MKLAAFQSNQKYEKENKIDDDEEGSGEIAKTAVIESPNEVIELNVSGYYYATTKNTLLKYPNSFFHDYLSSKLQLKDKSGRIFIDRNGVMFEYILFFLRYNSVTIPDYKQLKLLKMESEFYRIPMDIQLEKYNNKYPYVLTITPVFFYG